MKKLILSQIFFINQKMRQGFWNYLFYQQTFLFVIVTKTLKMTNNPLILQLISYLTSKDQQSPKQLLLMARYHHQKHMCGLDDVLCLIFAGTTINTHQELHYQRLIELYKSMFFSADIFLTLHLATKIVPGMTKLSVANCTKEIKSKGYQELLRAVNTSGAEYRAKNKILLDVRHQVLKMLQWEQRIGYFSLYFHILNRKPQHCKEDISSFQLQMLSDEENTFSQQQIKELGRQMLTECQKLKKKTNRQEVIEVIYKWVFWDLKKAFTAQPEQRQLYSTFETIQKMIQTQNNLVCSIIIQVMSKAIGLVATSGISNFISLVDEMIVSGNSETALQASITIVPYIFNLIMKKELMVEFQFISCHFLLWKQAIQKRSLSSKLLVCLNAWLPLFFQGKQINRQQYGEKLQLYRLQLLKLHKESRFSHIRNHFQQLQMKILGDLYEELAPFHSQIQELQESNHKEKSAASYQEIQRVKFDFQVSEASEKDQIRSLMQSLRSNNSEQKVVLEQLQIFSKRHSLNKKQKSSIVLEEDISAIIKVLDVFEEKTLISSFANFSFKESQPLSYIENVPFLPLNSAHTVQESIVSQERQCQIDRYGLKQRGKINTKELNLNIIPLRLSLKKKIVKNRGILVKNTTFQVNYIIESLNFRRRLVLFFTFYKKIAKAQMTLKEKSLKFWKKIDFQFISPKQNEQYRSALQIEKVKLYQIEGIQNSLRFVKPKVQATITEYSEQEQNQVHQIPFYLFNIAEWMEIEEKEKKFFEFEPQVTSSWYQVCRKIQKNTEVQLKTYFPLMRMDKKGNICLKFGFFMEIVLAKLFLVLDQVRVVLINSNSELALMALLEMVCTPDGGK